jgi:hypothetical protein
MEVILSGIAILLSLVSCFFLGREKANKQSVGKLSSRISELKKNIDNIQKQVNSLGDRLGPESPSFVQADGASNEISTLKAEIAYIKRDLRTNTQMLSIHSQAIDAIKQNQSASQPTAVVISESIDQKINTVTEGNKFPQVSNLFPSLEAFASFETEQPIQIQPTEDFSLIAELPDQPPEPYQQVAQQYQDARDRGDRQALRQLQFKELNITSESEDSLLRGSNGQATKLEAVLGGGSYMVVTGEGQYWLFPTAQTLDSFSMNQPQKGIFDYEHEILSRPVVKKPAEVREESDYWVVVAQGVISIPG